MPEGLLERMLQRMLLALIRGYRFLLSPWIGNSCRYWPTCSQYAEEALLRYGVARGSWLAMKRLGRCQPYGRGGVDPVPEALAARCTCDRVSRSLTD